MSLLAKLKKNSTVKETDTLEDSKFFDGVESVSTPVYAMNLALSAKLDGGLSKGLLTIAAESKHFKTLFGLILAAAYLKKYPEAVLLFYDSEFGSPKTYFSSLGIDLNRVIHTPIINLESLRHDIAVQIEGIQKGDKVFILVDSVGNLASKKEAEDAISGKDAADMTRAKVIKSITRIVTPHLTLKDIPMVMIAHVYKEMALYPKTIVSGGSGIMLSSDNLWTITRAQEKNEKSKKIEGYDFTINVVKSRHVKENSKIPIQVRYDGGINVYSGMLELALESGNVIKPKNGHYQAVDPETGEILSGEPIKESKTNTAKFWNHILGNKTFNDYLYDKYKLPYSELIQLESTDDENEEE